MHELKLVVNRDKYDGVKNSKDYLRKYPNKLNSYTGVLISVNPFYDWLEENINNISYKLLKGFITNIVPLGDAGKKYFKEIAHKKTGFTIELWKLYIQLVKMHQEGTLKKISYLELYNLGYTGVFLFEKYPVDDIVKYL